MAVVFASAPFTSFFSFPFHSFGALCRNFICCVSPDLVESLDWFSGFNRYLEREIDFLGMSEPRVQHSGKECTGAEIVSAEDVASPQFHIDSTGAL